MKKLYHLFAILSIIIPKISDGQCHGTTSYIAAPDSIFTCADDSFFISANVSNGNTGWDFNIYKCSVSTSHNISDTNFVYNQIMDGISCGVGIYFVTADSAGCTLTKTIYGIIKPLPFITVSPLNILICEGTCATFTVSGGISYSWSPSNCLSNPYLNPITFCCPAGQYTYTVTGTSGNGCKSSSITKIVTVNPLPAISITPTKPNICEGDNITLSASGAMTYVWLGNGLTSSKITIYNVSDRDSFCVSGVDANGCVNSTCYTVAAHPLPVVNAGKDTCINAGGVASLCATGNGAYYLWTPPTALICTSCVCTSALPTTFTSYVVTNTSVYGCKGTDTVVVGILPFCQVEVKEISDNHGILIFPNPITSSFIIQFNIPLKNTEVIIYDMLGHEMMRKKLNGDRMEIERGNLVGGVYFVKVISNEKQFVQKIIVQ